MQPENQEPQELAANITETEIYKGYKIMQETLRSCMAENEELKERLLDVKVMLESGYQPRSSRKELAECIGKALDLIDLDYIELDDAVSEVFSKHT